MNIKRLFVLGIIFILAGCNKYNSKSEKPFIFSYEMNSIEPEHEEVINEWLAKARADKEIKNHQYGLDGYRYSFLPTYKDVEISFIYSEGEGKLKQRFIKGTSEDEVFVKIKLNTSICCNHYIYETDDSANSQKNVE